MFQTENEKKSSLVWRIDLRLTMKCMKKGTYVEIPREEITSQAVSIACKAFNEQNGDESYVWHWGLNDKGRKVYVIRRLQKE